MPPLNSYDVASDEVIEIQHHLVHLNADHHGKSLVDSFNALFHFSNGSQQGSGNATPYSSGDGEVSEDFIIVVCTLVPLLATVILIFLIAVAVRRMRRAESMQEVVRRNEFKMSNRTKRGLVHSNSTASSPVESNRDVSSINQIRVVPAPRLATQSSIGSSSINSTSSSSISNSVATSPTSIYFSQAPPWFLHSTSYYKSQYHLNKLHKQLSYPGSEIQSFHHSMHSLPVSSGSSNSSQVVDYNTMTNVSDTESDITTMTTNSTKDKKKSKKFKKVFQIINIPKRIRQAQAEKNRFNIYTIPMETREQLKQIYVY